MVSDATRGYSDGEGMGEEQMKIYAVCGKEYSEGVSMGILGHSYDYCSMECFSKACRDKKHAKDIAQIISRRQL